MQMNYKNYVSICIIWPEEVFIKNLETNALAELVLL